MTLSGQKHNHWLVIVVCEDVAMNSPTDDQSNDDSAAAATTTSVNNDQPPVFYDRMSPVARRVL